MKGDRLWNVVKAAEGRNLSALQQMGYHVSGAMLEKYHNLRQKSKRIRELKVALKLMWEDLPLQGRTVLQKRPGNLVMGGPH